METKTVVPMTPEQYFQIQAVYLRHKTNLGVARIRYVLAILLIIPLLSYLLYFVGILSFGYTVLVILILFALTGWVGVFRSRKDMVISLLLARLDENYQRENSFEETLKALGHTRMH